MDVHNYQSVVMNMPKLESAAQTVVWFATGHADGISVDDNELSMWAAKIAILDYLEWKLYYQEYPEYL